jgi:hypothetical protein
MGFVTGTKNVATIVAELAAGLEAGADWVMHDQEVPGGYCLLYTPDNTYVTIKAYAGTGCAYNSSDYQWSGIAMIFSTGFDTTAHEPTGTIYNGCIPFFWQDHANNAALIANDRLFSVNFWVDNSGFVMSWSNPFYDATSCGGVVLMEAIPAAKREFSDGYRALMFHCNLAGTKETWFDYQSTYTPDNAAVYYLNVRPFARACCSSLVNYPAHLDAYRSQGNSKIYFEFPWFHNDVTNGRATPTRDHYNNPIYQTRRFFYVRKSGGLALNDVVQWLDPTAEPPAVRKFIVTDISSGDNNPTVYAAIPYDNAYVY